MLVREVRRRAARSGAAERARPAKELGGPARLVWPGRSWEPGACGLATVKGEGGRLTTVEVPRGEAAEAARLLHGDALEVARALAREGLTGRVDLVYVDPPFASQAEYVHEARLDGRADGRVARLPAYDDRWEGSLGAYLDMLAPRLEALAALLAPSGTLWVHVDWRASYLVRLLLDEILGREAFVNEIVWRRAPNLGRQAASHQFGRTLDTLVVYGRVVDGVRGAKLVPPTRLEPIEPSAVRWDEAGRPFTTAPRGDYTDESIARLEKEGRVHRTASGKAYIKYFLVRDADGAWCRERRVDALWTDVPPLRHARVGERTGYPTQKPRALLDRIVACASPPGGLVVDLFAGSGTTGESAHALGRRFVLGDGSPLALATARARLLRAGVPLSVARCEGATPLPGKRPRVTVERREPADGGRARLRVVLREPVEPLAWAVDTACDASRPFVRAWHSERVPGARAQPVARECEIDAGAAGDSGAPSERSLVGVRVFYDDGRVGTTVVEAP
jgi:DNA modification methylase